MKHIGLTEAQVNESRTQYGSNALTPPVAETFWQKYWGAFKDPAIYILVFALLLIGVLAVIGYAEIIEAVGIAIAVLIATFVATISEHKNENHFQELQEKASQIQVKVYRNGKIQNILIDDLVIGDLVLLQNGDKVPADGIIIEGSAKVSQASLTGESEPVTKKVTPNGYTSSEGTIELTDQYYIFRESAIEDGEVVMQVTTVGDNSFYGKLNAELGTDDVYYEINEDVLAKAIKKGYTVTGLDAIIGQRFVGNRTFVSKLTEILGENQDDLIDFLCEETEEELLTPLKEKLSDLADAISKFGFYGGGFIALSFLFKALVIDNGWDWSVISAFLFTAANIPLIVKAVANAVALAAIIIVVAVPEGLPMMIAIVLSQNMGRLLKQQVLVRKLLGIETAGSMNILFSDKTGTITSGELQVVNLVTGDNKTATTFESLSSELKKQVEDALRYNTGSRVNVTNGDVQIVGGNGTEQALLGYIKEALKGNGREVRVVEDVKFNSTNKFSAAKVEGSVNATYVKGAPEKVLQNCTSYIDANGNLELMSKNNLEVLNQTIDELSGRAMRCLAIAVTDSDLNGDNVPENLTLIGVVGIRDEIRQSSKDAIAACQAAGIQVCMITGDKDSTAEAIAKEAGLITSDSDVVLTSAQFNEMSDNQIKEILPNLKVLARALPTDKSRLVRIAQELNLVAGMTGDGVNDAPALKRADVGFAMGSGTEVAKSASDIVILDDNFSSIAKAVLYGRTIYNSIRKFIIFQLTVNVAAIAVAFLGPFVGFDFPLTMIQLLWVNLVMDTLAALAFGGEFPLPRYMQEQPKNRSEKIISGDMWSSILVNGFVMAGLSLTFLLYAPIQELFSSPEAWMTGFFAFFIFLNNFNKFNARTERLNLFDHLVANKQFIGVVILIFVVQIIFTYFGGSFLRTVPLSALEWIYVIGMSVVIIPIDLLRKLIRNVVRA